MIWTENRTTKKSIHTQRVLEAYLREKNATQQPHQRWKLRSQLCLKYSQAILISCWFFSSMGTSVLWLRASCSIYHSIFDSCKSERVLFVAVIIVSQLILSMWWVFVAVVGVFFLGMLLLVLRRPRNCKYINNKTGIKPAAKMTCNRDTHEWFVFSTWLDVYTVFHCSILSIRTTMPNRYYLLGKEERERAGEKNELNTIKTWFVSFSLASAT